MELRTFSVSQTGLNIVSWNVHDKQWAISWYTGKHHDRELHVLHSAEQGYSLIMFIFKQHF